MNIRSTLAATPSVVFGLGACGLLFTSVYDVQLHFLTGAQSLATVAIIGAVGTFGVSPKAFNDVLHRQRIVVGGVAALITYASVAALAPWLMATASTILAAAACAVLMVKPADRVSSWASIVIVTCLVARSIAFFSTTFLRGVQ